MSPSAASASNSPADNVPCMLNIWTPTRSIMWTAQWLQWHPRHLTPKPCAQWHLQPTHEPRHTAAARVGGPGGRGSAGCSLSCFLLCFKQTPLLKMQLILFTGGNTGFSVAFYIGWIYFVCSSGWYHKTLLKRWRRSNKIICFLLERLFKKKKTTHNLPTLFLTFQLNCRERNDEASPGILRCSLARCWWGCRTPRSSGCRTARPHLLLLRSNPCLYSLTNLSHPFTTKGQAVIRIRFSVLFQTVNKIS